MDKLRVISLGWGVQSWSLVAMAAMGELDPVDFAIHADTTWEHKATYDHARTWTAWLGDHGVKVVTVQGNRTDVVREDWSNSVLIPAFTVDAASGTRGQIKRQCTHDWKIMPIRAFVRAEMKRRGLPMVPGAVQSIQGISLDEWQRMRSSDVAYIENVYPLVDMRMTRGDCVTWLEGKGLPVPAKSSCVFCPYKSIGSWKELKRAGGTDWETATAVDVAVRSKRPKAELFVHPGRVALTEAIAIPEDQGAHQLELQVAPCDSGHCFV